MNLCTSAPQLHCNTCLKFVASEEKPEWPTCVIGVNLRECEKNENLLPSFREKRNTTTISLCLPSALLLVTVRKRHGRSANRSISFTIWKNSRGEKRSRNFLVKMQMLFVHSVRKVLGVFFP